MKINNAGLSETLNFIESTCKKFDSKFVFDYEFLDKTYEKVYESETTLGKIFNSFALLAIIISCLGLLGLVSYVAESRTKEIGIRKVLGASVGGIVFSLSKEFIIWILFANLIAWPIAYYFMNKWLQDFAYRIDIGWWIFMFAGCIALVIALITISFQAIKAATANPIKSLRYE